MRREVLFSFVGFLCGLAVATVAFRTSVTRTENKTATAASDAGSAGKAEHQRRRLAVTTRAGENPGAAVFESASRKKEFAEIFHETLGQLTDTDPRRRQLAIESLVTHLRAAGPQALPVLREYFRLGKDVKIDDMSLVQNGRYIRAPSLRATLLNVLGEWNGKEATDMKREVLHATTQIAEAVVLAQQLEKQEPGVHRNESIRELQQIFEERGRGKSVCYSDKWALFDAVAHLKAPELLPIAETEVLCDPRSFVDHMDALESLPADVRAASLLRMFAKESVVEHLASDPFSARRFNYSEPIVAEQMARIFSENMDKKCREYLLTGFTNEDVVYSGASGSFREEWKKMPAIERVAKLQARLAFLDTIAPQCDTPVLQERLQDARTELQKAVANPNARKATQVGSIISR